MGLESELAYICLCILSCGFVCIGVTICYDFASNATLCLKFLRVYIPPYIGSMSHDGVVAEQKANRAVWGAIQVSVSEYL